MFLLITGASGVGKSTLRRRLEKDFADVLVTAELADLIRTPQWSLRWRHQAVEKAVRRSLEVQRERRHFLLCGDPVPPGEVLAAPSADRLGRLAVCLLDASEEVQTQRLRGRGDDPALISRHVAFARWMRSHVADPGHRPDVIMHEGWGEMRWERWLSAGKEESPWDGHVIDTSRLNPAEVSELASIWIRRTISRAEEPSEG